jgi:hypothetical protein
MQTKKMMSAVTCLLLMASLPGRAELLQVELSVFGMD